MALTIEKIKEFWDWFSKHSLELARDPDSQSLIRELEAHLFAICQVDWEIGPGVTAANMFALSPGGDFKFLDVTQKIVEFAPELPDWQFSAAKLPRQWGLRFTIDHDGIPVEIDAKQWEYVLYRFRDGTFDLLFKPDDRKSLSQEELELAALIIVDGELGEENRMRLVGEIEVVDRWEPKEASHAKPLGPKVLAKAIGLNL